MAREANVAQQFRNLAVSALDRFCGEGVAPAYQVGAEACASLQRLVELMDEALELNQRNVQVVERLRQSHRNASARAEEKEPRGDRMSEDELAQVEAEAHRLRTRSGEILDQLRAGTDGIAEARALQAEFRQVFETRCALDERIQTERDERLWETAASIRRSMEKVGTSATLLAAEAIVSDFPTSLSVRDYREAQLTLRALGVGREIREAPIVGSLRTILTAMGGVTTALDALLGTVLVLKDGVRTREDVDALLAQLPAAARTTGSLRAQHEILTGLLPDPAT